MCVITVSVCVYACMSPLQKQYSGSSERHSKIFMLTAAAVVASTITWDAIFGHQYGLL